MSLSTPSEPNSTDKAEPQTPKHAPGPWEARDVAGAGWKIYATLGPDRARRDHAEYVLRSDTGIPIFSIAYETWVQFEPAEWKEMQAANARLIASAPTLAAENERLRGALALSEEDAAESMRRYHEKRAEAASWEERASVYSGTTSAAEELMIAEKIKADEIEAGLRAEARELREALAGLSDDIIDAVAVGEIKPSAPLRIWLTAARSLLSRPTVTR